jgi:hypothetical protein
VIKYCSANWQKSRVRKPFTIFILISPQLPIQLKNNEYLLLLVSLHVL